MLKKSPRKRVFIALLLCLISMIGASLVQTSGRKVIIKDLRWETPTGYQMSALLLKPRTATPQNPAPAIVTSHGWFNNREMRILTMWKWLVEVMWLCLLICMGMAIRYLVANHFDMELVCMMLWSSLLPCPMYSTELGSLVTQRLWPPIWRLIHNLRETPLISSFLGPMMLP